MDLITALSDLANGNLDAEAFGKFLHGTAQADFTAWSFKVAVVYALMRGRLKGISTSVEAFKTEINLGFKNLATEFSGLNKRVEALEQPKKEVKL